MSNQIIEILEATLMFSLNPTTWVIVIFLAIRAKQLWIPAISGVLAQIASLIPLAIYLERIDDALFRTPAVAEISVYNILSGEGVSDMVLLSCVPLLSGLMISALVIPLVRQRQLQPLTSS